ncbi:uncharacterized protein [Parasteatoda tepidariorum]|uniref:uncharacterized protein n=1 Tax=Parasteatoda tepidariorum TaxID=114398 RepID=UPI001C719D4C|nr:uncharacterized protein LOC122273277 [Parasteatoda tepidariorum]
MISALYLAGYGRFDGTHLEEELMAKQAKLLASVAVSKNSLSSEFLSMLINGLLITCHNPRHFFGQNLIELLKEEIESSNNFTHPITYLSLCNANQSWTLNAEQDMDKILSINNSFYEFFKGNFQRILILFLQYFRKSNR